MKENEMQADGSEEVIEDDLDSSVKTSEDAENFFEWYVEPSTLAVIVKNLKTEAVRNPAEVFAANIQNLNDICSMPINIAADGIRTWLQSLAMASIKRNGHIEMDREALRKKAQEKYKSIVDAEGINGVAALITNAVSALREWPQIVRAEESLRYAAITLLWTAFENLARDMWVSAVNASESAIAHRVIRSLPTEPTQADITRRSINVSLLARHHFDLRGRLGSLLESKFKFSQLKGAKLAYTSAFDHSSSIAAVFDNRELERLEKTRHLIVHRAGMIDQRFSELTGCSGAIGERIEIPSSDLRAMGQAVIDSGARLVELIDDRLMMPVDP